MDPPRGEIPFGIPLLPTLFDELIDPRSPFCLFQYYTVSRAGNSNSYLKFESPNPNLLPRYLLLHGIEVHEQTKQRDFNVFLSWIEKELEEIKDYELLIPIGVKFEGDPMYNMIPFYNSIFGHFLVAFIRVRNRIAHIKIFNSKADDETDRFDRLVLLLERAFPMNHSCEIVYCQTQKLEDIVNCGYYMFKIIYNYLLLSSRQEFIGNLYAVNMWPEERTTMEIIKRIVCGESTYPYEYPNIQIGDLLINYLTVRERNYLFECIKRERIRSQGLLMVYQ